MKKRLLIWVTDRNPYSSVRLQALLLQGVLKGAGYECELLPNSQIGVFRSILRSFKYEEVLLTFYSADARLFAFWLRKHVTLIYHNITPARFFLSTEPLVALRALVGRWQLRLTPHWWRYLAVSEYNQRELWDIGKKDAALAPCIVRAFQGIRSQKAATATVLFTGRIVENKNCLELLDIVESAAKSFEGQITLIVVGTGNAKRSFYKKFSSRVAQINGSGVASVRWIQNALSQSDLDEVYAKAWLYLSASLHEGFGLPVCEAISSGTPALYVACGGTESVLQRVGLLEGGVSEFGMEVARYLRDPSLRAQLLATQAAVVNKYTVPGPGAEAVVSAIVGKVDRSK